MQDQVPVVNPEAQPAGELDLFAFFLLLRRNLRRILIFAFIGAILTIGLTFLMKPRFSASMSLLIPTQPTSSAAAVAMQAAGGFDILGGGVTVLYIDMLKSRTIADRMIEKYGLMERYHVKMLMQAEAALAAQTTITGEKDGLIRIVVQDGDPKRAAELANDYFTELDQLNQHLEISTAAQQRRYFEQEMVKEKNQLADAEVALRQTQESTGVFEPQLQAQAGVGAAENTRAQLRLRQIELTALLQSETPQNPDVIRVQSEIAGFESQLRAMQTGGGPATAGASNKVPAQAMAYVRNAREVKYHEALFEILFRQYEAAKEKEAKDFSGISILDVATPPEHKSWPPRTLYVLGGFFFGAILGIIYTLLQAFVRAVFRNPENRRRYQELKTPTTRSR